MSNTKKKLTISKFSACLIILVFQAAARYVYKTLTNSSIAISGMVGPVEQVALENHPIKGFYFMTVGSPQVCADPLLLFI